MKWQSQIGLFTTGGALHVDPHTKAYKVVIVRRDGSRRASRSSVNEWLLGKGQPHELTTITALNGWGLDYEGTSLVVGDKHDITEYPKPYTKAAKTIHLQNAVDQFQVSASDLNIVADGLDGTVAVYNLTGTVLRTLTLPGTNPDAFGVAYSEHDL